MEFLSKSGLKHLLTKMKPAIEEISRGGGCSGYYKGVDLTVRHKNEIQTFYNDNAWAWINDRVQKQNYEGIFVGDYIPVALTETQDGCGTNVHHMQVMGINTHTGSFTHQSGKSDVANNRGYLKGHIDFCALECYGSDCHAWNQNCTNNGTKKENCPYMVSDLRTYLTTAVYNALPAELKAVIVDKYAYIEGRYSSSGELEDSTSESRGNLGKIWAPTEYEIFGSAIWGTKSKSEGISVQYPLFRSQSGRSLFVYADDGSGDLARAAWWTASACGASSTCCVCVMHYGAADDIESDLGLCVPLCFRIAQA